MVFFFSGKEKHAAEDYTLQERCYIGCCVPIRYTISFSVSLTWNQADNLVQFVMEGVNAFCR